MHITQKEVDFNRSLKKHILTEISGVSPFFEMQMSVPKNGGSKLNAWVVFEFTDRLLGTVSEQTIVAEIFVRKDTEHANMYQVSDIVAGLFVSEDGGPISIPFYDTSEDPWLIIGGILPTFGQFSEIYPAKDKTSVRSVPVTCRWGSI